MVWWSGRGERIRWKEWEGEVGRIEKEEDRRLQEGGWRGKGGLMRVRIWMGEYE